MYLILVFAKIGDYSILQYYNIATPKWGTLVFPQLVEERYLKISQDIAISQFCIIVIFTFPDLETLTFPSLLGKYMICSCTIVGQPFTHFCGKLSTL